MAGSQPTTGTGEAVWYGHLESAHIDSRTCDPNMEGVSVEGSEDSPPADQHRKGAVELPRVELQHEKHT